VLFEYFSGSPCNSVLTATAPYLQRTRTSSAGCADEKEHKTFGMEPAYVIKPGTSDVLDVLGPTVEILTPPSPIDAAYCVMRGTIPAGVSVPLHSHPDDESFFLLSGAVQALRETRGSFEWFDISEADFIHIPAGVKHAWRNNSAAPAVALITTTARLGRFFREIGIPIRSGAPPMPPNPEVIQRFISVSGRYHHWLGTPEENAGVGIQLPVG
jgi:quercetin dioxygenase-like cupin family protein